ncbi:MAG: SGNH/GDSL hydrolase family protein, partial [Clostridium sp.]
MASELWMDIEVDYDLYEQWISIEINGEFISRQMITKGSYSICIFRGMNNEKVKNVRIYKEVQPMNKDNNCIFLIHGLRTDGEFREIQDKKIKIEFIGDSISSGEGIIGAKQEEDWIPMFFGVIDNYAVKTAKKFDADFRIISQSGWGVLSSWDNNPNYALPKYYEQICGVVNGERNKQLGAWEPNDFNSWKPDFIVVNLGTNDGSAFTSPEWNDEFTNKKFKQHIDEDGNYNKNDVKRFEEAVIKFLCKIRKNNKDSKIIWAYGMLGTSMMEYIYHAVYEYKREYNDKNVYITQLSAITEETIGARKHPGKLNHQIASEQLFEFISSLG